MYIVRDRQDAHHHYAREGHTLRIRTAMQAAALLALAGCANVQPVLPATAAADANSGYLAGLFSHTKVAGFAFIVKESNTGREYTMPLGEDGVLPTEARDLTVAIKLPPGIYRVTEWITYATLVREILSREKVDNASLSRPFQVEPGSVVHLGAYTVSQDIDKSRPITMYFQIGSIPCTQSVVQRAFSTAYPGLAAYPLKCLMCTDDPGGMSARSSTSARQ